MGALLIKANKKDIYLNGSRIEMLDVERNTLSGSSALCGFVSAAFGP